MLFSIYFSVLYRVPTLLMPFSPLEVALTPTTLLLQMRNENSLVDIYVWDLYVYYDTWMYMDDTFMYMDKTYVYG
jgi:hypothetical protein